MSGVIHFPCLFFCGGKPVNEWFACAGDIAENIRPAAKRDQSQLIEAYPANIGNCGGKGKEYVPFKLWGGESIHMIWMGSKYEAGFQPIIC